VWANDNKSVFYVTKDSTLRAYKVMRHILGTDPQQDELIFHEKDNTFSVYIDKTKSDKYILLISEQTLSTEIKLIHADRPDEPYFVFQEREKDHEYYIYNHINKFYVLTNWNAKNFRLMETQSGTTTKEHWSEVIPQRDDVLLENITVFKDYVVMNERKEGIKQLRIINLKGQSEHYLKFDEEVYVAYPSNNYAFDTSILRLEYSSLTTPTSTYDYDMNSRAKSLLKMEEVGAGFDPENYQSKRLWAIARDGTKVPISLVYHKNFAADGQNPPLLYGYGSYGSSRDPYFNSTTLSLLDRGFVYAIAHVRGGSEMGRYWYEDGKLLNKKNTFTDFIDCAEFLIAQNYTNPDRLFARGGSAGGLLMGAVVTMRPDLFKGIIAAVPWVDVVTTMLDPNIPLTTSEFDEWGDPKEKAYYEYMLSYSPYDNIVAKDYPAMYITTGFHDSQVQYFEPAKWVAKIREMKTDKNLLILDVDFKSGHDGASGRFNKHKRKAPEFAFMLDLLGISK
jgi:oligopeptidase B